MTATFTLFFVVVNESIICVSFSDFLSFPVCPLYCLYICLYCLFVFLSARLFPYLSSSSLLRIICPFFIERYSEVPLPLSCSSRENF